MQKTPRIKDYNAQNRDIYNQERTHTGKRKMLTARSRIIFTILLTLLLAAVGYAIVIIGWRMIYQFSADLAQRTSEAKSLADIDFKISIGWPTRNEWIAIGIWTAGWGLLFANFFKRNLEAQNAMNDKSDINEYEDDQYLATPDEIMGTYAFFPDMGAHAGIQVSSLISHVMLKNKGIKNIEMAERAEEDIVDDDGNLIYRKGELLEDEEGNIITTSAPMIDEKFSKKIFNSSKVPKEFQLLFDVRKIPYNPGKKTYGKLPYETATDLINGTWDFPDYEIQRPSGAYLVDTNPVNTMVIASTRAGKGELARFVWRQANPNMLIACKSLKLFYLNSRVKTHAGHLSL